MRLFGGILRFCWLSGQIFGCGDRGRNYFLSDPQNPPEHFAQPSEATSVAYKHDPHSCHNPPSPRDNWLRFPWTHGGDRTIHPQPPTPLPRPHHTMSRATTRIPRTPSLTVMLPLLSKLRNVAVGSLPRVPKVFLYFMGLLVLFNLNSFPFIWHCESPPSLFTYVFIAELFIVQIRYLDTSLASRYDSFFTGSRCWASRGRPGRSSRARGCTSSPRLA